MPEPIVGIEFYNRSATQLLVWLELCCHELVLLPDTEYRLESVENEYRLEWDGDRIIFYYQRQFGPRVLFRPASKEIRNSHPWQLDIDYSNYS